MSLRTCRSSCCREGIAPLSVGPRHVSFRWGAFFSLPPASEASGGEGSGVGGTADAATKATRDRQTRCTRPDAASRCDGCRTPALATPTSASVQRASHPQTGDDRRILLRFRKPQTQACRRTRWWTACDNAADERRTAFLASKGYRVLRFWNNDVMENVDGVLLEIQSAIEQASPPTPDPSPPLASLAGGGE
jgi:hypothetical protein